VDESFVRFIGIYNWARIETEKRSLNVNPDLILQRKNGRIAEHESLTSVARFFLVQHTKTGKNLTKNQNAITCHKIQITNDQKLYQHFPFQGSPNAPKIGTFGMQI
jgi:hypothetical protein